MKGWSWSAAFALLALGLAPAPAAAGLDPGDHEFALLHKAQRRSYLVHVPDRARAGKPLPVVVNFHGAGANARIQKDYTRMDRAAQRDGYIAVYPNGSGGLGERFLTWNAGACCGWAAARGVDDVGFSLAMLDDLARRTPVDRARVYLTGLSNGSMMAYRVAAEAPHRIAAVAGVAGALSVTGPGTPRAPAMPVMHIHSVDDRRALYEGGLGPALPYADTRVFHPAVDDMVARWRTRNDCAGQAKVGRRLTGDPGTNDATHTATRHVYASCREGVEVVLWKLTGAGHVWPGGVRDYLKLLLGPGTGVIDANAEMWRFFVRFRRTS